MKMESGCDEPLRPGKILGPSNVHYDGRGGSAKPRIKLRGRD
jgi:hypothetical protein